MTPIPPVYRLLFTNDAGLSAKEPLLIDASGDDEALQIVEGLLSRSVMLAATLWADERMVRQFASPSSAGLFPV